MGRNNTLQFRKVPEGQNPLPFRGERTGILAYALPWERRLLSALVGLLFVLAIFYIYFVMASIVHAASRQALLGKVGVLQTKVSVLESNYLSQTEGVTESYAHAIGFVTPAKQVFVERASALSFKDIQ